MPLVYLPWRAWRRPGTVPGRGTDLILDGFPRSGNTWAEHLIRHVGPGLRLAHHAHAIAPIRYGLARGVPVLVLLRRPADAVQSLMGMQRGARGPQVLLADYLHFYRWIARLQGPGMLLARFETVTRDPGAVISALNARFDLGLTLFDPATDPPAIRAAMDRAAAHRRGQARTGAHPEGRGAIPVYALPDGPLARAQACYERMTPDV